MDEDLRMLESEISEAEREARDAAKAAPVSRKQFKRAQLQEDESVPDGVTLRDLFALAFAAAGDIPGSVYESADLALAERGE